MLPRPTSIPAQSLLHHLSQVDRHRPTMFHPRHEKPAECAAASLACLLSCFHTSLCVTNSACAHDSDCNIRYALHSECCDITIAHASLQGPQGILDGVLQLQKDYLDRLQSICAIVAPIAAGAYMPHRGQMCCPCSARPCSAPLQDWQADQELKLFAALKLQ